MSIISFSGKKHSGKCLGINTPILMFNGDIKLVQNIKENDLIMGDDSTYRKVLSITNGIENLYEITHLINNETYIVNESHILSLYYTDNVMLFDNYECQMYQVESFDKILFKEKLKEFKYTSTNKHIVYENAKKYKDFIKIENKIIDIPLKSYLQSSKSLQQKLQGYKTSIDFNEKNADLDPYTLGLWLGNEKCNYKNIPDIYKINSRENRIKLLAGIINNNNEIYQKNHELMQDIIFLCNSLGFVYKVLEKQDKQIYKIRISNESNNISLSDIKIKNIGNGLYYGFILNGNHRFVLGNFIVTHNTELSKISRDYGYININFADSLKNLVCNCLNITKEELERQKDIIGNIIYNLDKNVLYISLETSIDENLIRDLIIGKSFKSIREILQFLGTDIIRRYNKEWHINKIRDILINNKEKKYTIGDTRFKNEKNLIDSLNGESWYIVRDSLINNDSHISENELSKDDFKNIIYNNSDKDTFIIDWKSYLTFK